MFLEQNEEYLDYNKNEQNFIIEKTLNSWLEVCFATRFKYVRHERWLISLLSLTDPDILKQSK